MTGDSFNDEQDNSDLPAMRDDAAKPGTHDFKVIQWGEAELDRARQFLEAQVNYNKIDHAISAIFSQESNSGLTWAPISTGPANLSRTRANFVAKTAEDITAQLTDTRIFWKYGTHNSKYEDQARLSNKEAEDWYTSRMIDLRFGDVVRYYCVAGTGVAHLYYSRRLNDMMVEAEDPRNVFPMDAISYHTFQDCRGVIIRKARTPHWVKEEYGKTVKPDVSSDKGFFGWFTRSLSSATKITGPLSKRHNKHGADAPIPATDTVYVNTMYLNDTRVNKKSTDVYMGKWKDGDPQTQWSYKVKPGEPLYPFKRLIVWGGGALLYDGPSPYWHAKFPVIKLTLNPWPMSWFGKAPIQDIISLNNSLNSTLRVVDDHLAKCAQPDVVADRNVSRTEFDKINSRAPGMKMRTNMASGKGVQINYPPALTNTAFQHIQWCQDTMQKLSGTFDPSQAATLAQIPSDDTIDTLMKAMTPGIRLRSRIFEGFMKEFAEMYLYCLFEFDSLTKRVAKFGAQAVTAEDYDFDPKTFIPDDVPDGSPGDIASTEDALVLDEPRPLFVRARMVLESFSYNFRPSSMLNSAAQQDLMEDFQLAKMGYLSVFTMYEHMGRMNFAGPDVVVPPDELGRLQLQQQLGVGMIANAQGRKATDAAPPKLQSNGQGDVSLTTS